MNVNHNPKTYAEYLEYVWGLTRDFAKPGLGSRGTILKREAQRLLDWLYDPVPEAFGWRCSPRTDALGLGRDAINWGDLRVIEVKALAEEDKFMILIEEAAPDANNLRRWLTERLHDWGWNVEVITEW